MHAHINTPSWPFSLLFIHILWTQNACVKFSSALLITVFELFASNVIPQVRRIRFDTVSGYFLRQTCQA